MSRLAGLLLGAVVGKSEGLQACGAEKVDPW